MAIAAASMAPALEPGDCLLIDPTCRRWPRRGSVVIAREPGTGLLVVKRVAARPGDRVVTERGIFALGPDEAWLLGDADDDAASSRGYGPVIDSRRYGPVPLTALVGRAWFRYWPARRIGRIPRR